MPPAPPSPTLMRMLDLDRAPDCQQNLIYDGLMRQHVVIVKLVAGVD